MNELLDDNWGKEAVSIEYTAAGLGERFLAFVVDTFLFFLLMTIVVFITGSDLATIITLVLAVVVLLSRDATSKSASLGKHLMKIKVVQIDHTKVHWVTIILRTFLKYLLAWAPIFFAITTFIAKSQRKDEQQVFMHDVVTKTKVVRIISKKER